MTWTYDVTALTTPLNAVRLAIGDTLSSDPQLQDEEINRFIEGRSTLDGACADCCLSLASKYSRSVNQKAADSATNFSDMSKAYRQQAVMFNQLAASTGAAMPYAGGISRIDKLRQVTNTDRVRPQFDIGMDDNLLIPTGQGQNETDESGAPQNE